MHVLANEAESAARRLAELRGLGLDQVILEAVEAQMRLVTATRRRPNFARMMEVSDRCSKRPVLDGRSADDIIGYDDFGLPT